MTMYKADYATRRGFRELQRRLSVARRNYLRLRHYCQHERGEIDIAYSLQEHRQDEMSRAGAVHSNVVNLTEKSEAIKVLINVYEERYKALLVTMRLHGIDITTYKNDGAVYQPLTDDDV